MDQKHINILTILPILGHPRDSKRITMLQQAGFVVEVVAFERDYHTGRLPTCPIERLGKITNKHYFRRILKIIIAIPTIRRAIQRNQIIYASGQDMAATALIAGLGLHKHVVLEVGDITDLQLSKGIKGFIMRSIEKRLVNLYRLLVVTSPDFLNVYYRKWLKVKTPALIIENKLEPSSIDNTIAQNFSSQLSGKPLIDRPLRIGYFGLLRDKWSWEVLEKLASLGPHKFEIILAGLPINPIDIPQRIKKYINMKYLGNYRSPQGLPSLYNSVDMIWACYPYIKPNDWNLRWAIPNRFFESCAFRKPTFARAGCHFALDVEHYKIGMIIKNHEVKKVVDTICKIQIDDLMLWQKNLSKIPRNIYMYTTEGHNLSRAIKKIVQK